HAAAADLEPPLVPAALATCPRADAAGDVELEARLGEGEVTRPDADLAFVSVHRLDQVEQRALHVADGQALVHRQTLDLAEVRQSGCLGRVTAIAPPRRDDVDRRFL